MSTDIPENVMLAAVQIYVESTAANLPSQSVEIIARAIMDERKRCAKVARNGCLVPPDGGAPTEDERLMCERIADGIMEGWKP